MFVRSRSRRSWKAVVPILRTWHGFFTAPIDPWKTITKNGLNFLRHHFSTFFAHFYRWTWSNSASRCMRIHKHTHTHLKDRMSPLVLELFRVMGKFPGRPYVAVIHMGIHEWFLAWPPCHDQRKWPTSSKNWKMWILHFRTGTWILRSESTSGTCNSLFVGLPPCYKSGSPPVWNIEWENRTNKNAKREQPLGTGFDSHTKAVCRRDHFWLHRSPMAWYTSDGEKPCCTYKSASWRKLGSIAEDGNEYFLIRWARLFKPLSLSR